MQEKITNLLRETNREGVNDLITYMESEGFFTAPASTKYHGCYERAGCPFIQGLWVDIAIQP